LEKTITEEKFYQLMYFSDYELVWNCSISTNIPLAESSLNTPCIHPVTIFIFVDCVHFYLQSQIPSSWA